MNVGIPFLCIKNSGGVQTMEIKMDINRGEMKSLADFIPPITMINAAQTIMVVTPGGKVSLVFIMFFFQQAWPNG